MDHNEHLQGSEGASSVEAFVFEELPCKCLLTNRLFCQQHLLPSEFFSLVSFRFSRIPVLPVFHCFLPFFSSCAFFAFCTLLFTRLHALCSQLFFFLFIFLKPFQPEGFLIFVVLNGLKLNRASCFFKHLF